MQPSERRGTSPLMSEVRRDGRLHFTRQNTRNSSVSCSALPETRSRGPRYCNQVPTSPNWVLGFSSTRTRRGPALPSPPPHRHVTSTARSVKDSRSSCPPSTYLRAPLRRKMDVNRPEATLYAAQPTANRGPPSDSAVLSAAPPHRFPIPYFFHRFLMERTSHVNDCAAD